MLLSVCMIVKNESENLKRCLDSIQGIYDELIIIDTGSVDNTIEIAKKYTDKIFYSKWKNDFAYHRNESISKARGEWVFIIDADEELCGQKEAIRPALENMSKDFNSVVIELIDIIKNKTPMKFNFSRFFRNGKIEYRYPWHNQPVCPPKVNSFPFINLKHYGYDLTEEQRAIKKERTARLIEEFKRQYPDDYRVYFYLTQYYSSAGDNEKSLECGEIYLSHEEDIEKSDIGFNPSVYYTLIQNALAIKKPEVARKYLSIAEEKIQNDIDIAYAGMVFGEITGDAEKVHSSAIKFIKLFNAHTKDKNLKSFRFCYHHNSECLTHALFRLSTLQLESAIINLEQFNKSLQYCNQDYKEHIKKDMAQAMGKMGANWLSWGGANV